jgi:hypothetical protein
MDQQKDGTGQLIKLLLLPPPLLLTHFSKGQHALQKVKQFNLTTSEFFSWWLTQQCRNKHSGHPVDTWFFYVLCASLKPVNQ